VSENPQGTNAREAGHPELAQRYEDFALAIGMQAGSVMLREREEVRLVSWLELSACVGSDANLRYQAPDACIEPQPGKRHRSQSGNGGGD
jgi:hypothetical protein